MWLTFFRYLRSAGRQIRAQPQGQDLRALRGRRGPREARAAAGRARVDLRKMGRGWEFIGNYGDLWCLLGIYGKLWELSLNSWDVMEFHGIYEGLTID